MMDVDEIKIETAKKIIPLLENKEWLELVAQMELHLDQLIKNTESKEFVKEAFQNPVVFADAVSFRRGIRYVIDYPRRLERAAKRSAQRLSERQDQD